MTAQRDTAHARTRLARTVLLALACLLLAALVLRQAAFVRSIAAEGAVVAAEGHAILAPAAGTLAYFRTGEKVRRGEPLLGIETRDRRAAILDAPISGRIVARLGTVGDRLRAGEPVAILGGPEARPFLRIFVDPRAVLALGPSLRALADLPDGRRLDMPVDPRGMRASAATPDRAVLDLAVDGLDPAAVGRPAALRLVPDGALLRWWLGR